MKLTTAEAIRRLEEVGIPCAPIADYREVFTNEVGYTDDEIDALVAARAAAVTA